MKIGKKLSNYVTEKGTIQFVYDLIGTENELKGFQEMKVAQGYGTMDDKAVFHSPRPLEAGTNVILNYAKTRYIANQDLEVAYKEQRIEQAIAREYVRASGVRARLMDEPEPEVEEFQMNEK